MTSDTAGHIFVNSIWMIIRKIYRSICVEFCQPRNISIIKILFSFHSSLLGRSHLCQYSSSLFFILLHIQFFQLVSLSLQLLGRFSKISHSCLQVSLGGIKVTNLLICKVIFVTKILIESGINI